MVQQPGAAHEQGDAGTEGLPRGRHLDTDHAAAHDGESAGHLCRRGGLTAGPRPDGVDAGNRRHHGAASGRHDDGVPRGQRARAAAGGAHHDTARAVEAAVSAHEVGADPVDPLGLAVVLPIAGELVAAGEHRGGVEAAGDRLGRAAHAAGGGESLDRPQQRFAWHARPVGAFAADQFAFDDRAREPGRAHTVRGVLAGGSRAQHDDVVRRLAVVPARVHRACLPVATCFTRPYVTHAPATARDAGQPRSYG